MEVISFDISGKIAHFRKYYSNNTALSFSIPPRTTIMGILAAIYGMPKDSYYELFSSQNLDIGIAPLSRMKKTIHRLNFLKILGSGDFKGRQGRIQTPFEIVTGYNIKDSTISYRIFLHPLEIPKEVYEQLKELISIKGNSFALTLGAANFNAYISNYQEYNSEETVNLNGFLHFDSAINSDDILEIELEKEAAGTINIVEEELMPADFVANYNRELQKMNRMLFSVSGSKVKANLKDGAVLYKLSNNNLLQTIQFMK